MKAKVVFVDLSEPITKDKLEELLEEAYEQGYGCGYSAGLAAATAPVMYPHWKENWIPTWNDDTTKTAPKWDQYHIYCDTDIRPMGDIIH